MIDVKKGRSFKKMFSSKKKKTSGLEVSMVTRAKKS